MTQTTEWKKTQPGSTEAVQFSDGMLVTAEDLTAAMQYPLSVIQVLLKAYFGCGIVCGLGLRNPVEPKYVRNAAGQLVMVPPEGDPNYILMVDKGVALGCDGYPIEICSPLKLDLTPDPCCVDRDDDDKEMFIAARRVKAAEATARACGCGSTGGEPAQQCSRMRDHVLVQAFEERDRPPGICEAAEPPPPQATSGQPMPGVPAVERQTGLAAICACLKQCGECGCCGEPWVLLGSVMVGKQGLGRIDLSKARYVKPIACACESVERDQVPFAAHEPAARDRPETTGEPATPSEPETSGEPATTGEPSTDQAADATGTAPAA